MMEAVERLQFVADAAEVASHFPTWCSLVKIRTKSGGLIPFDYERWHTEQRRFERDRTGRDLVLKPRQVGFSTLELARDLWTATTHEGVNVTVAVHERELAEQLFLVVRTMLDELRTIGLAPRTRHDNRRELVFDDLHSAVRVVEAGATEASASKKGRSGTIHRLHATELAYWSAAQTTMTALLGCDPSEVVIESTANGAGGLFYDLVQEALGGRGGYRLHFFPWHKHRAYRQPIAAGFDPTPRDDWERAMRSSGCDDQQIAWWRTRVADPAIGLEKALQEWPIDPHSCFRASGRQYIAADALDRLARAVRAPLRVERMRGMELRVYRDPRPGAQYILSCDVAEGVGQDASGALAIERKTGEIDAVLWSDSVEAGDVGLALAALAARYNGALVAAERNNHGHATIRALEREAKYPHIYCHDDGRLGWITTPATRPPLFDELRMAIEAGAVWTPDAQVLAEARTIIRDDDGRPRAKGKGLPGGCRDDLFVAWGIGWQVRQRPEIDPMPIHIPNL